jgi:glyoxylase-like metal-dependent hydrolase (beta-lactamase superfamily II)
MQRIMNGIYISEGLRLGNVYVIEAADGLTLVDTSVPGSLPRIEKDLRSAGHKLSDIKRILITHAHWDHHGSLAELKEATGARVYAHHRCESTILRGERKPVCPPYSQLSGFDRVIAATWVRPRLKFNLSVQVDCELKEGDRLDEVLPGLTVVDIPGHSPGQCGFWQPEHRLFFGGDLLMRTPWGRFLLPMAAATPNMEEAKRSIRKVAEMNVATLCQGHGKPCIGNAGSLIRAFADKLC